MKYTIYTDGSDLKHTSHRMGIGGILIREGQKLDEFSQELSHEYLQEEYGTSDCSNPTAEMIAAREALEKWSEYFRQGDEVELKSDYIGVRDWNCGAWRINKPYIRKAHDEIQKIIKETGIKVTFTWIKGHQTGPSLYGTDKYWNDLVDKLSKGVS